MKMSFFGYNRKETDDYFDYLTKANAELTEQVEQLKKKNAEMEKALSEYENLDKINKREIEMLGQKLDRSEASEDDYKRRFEEVCQKLDSKDDALDNEKLGIIFAVAYRDMENKNKAVSEKIREYADMMFGRMAKYQNEVAEIVTEVNEMQLKQKKALEKLCSEAAEKLDMLTAASDKTLSDMQRIEGSKNAICGQIENMINETIDTGKALNPPSKQ